jgi:hypothetical protein
MARDENTLNAHVNPSCWEVGEGNAPIFFTFFYMRFENELMHTILDAEEICPCGGSNSPAV